MWSSHCHFAGDAAWEHFRGCGLMFPREQYRRQLGGPRLASANCGLGLLSTPWGKKLSATCIE